METNDVILIGVNEIETRLRRSYQELVALKKDYGFPLNEINGVSTVILRELSDWVNRWGSGLPLEKITKDVLDAQRARFDRARNVRQRPDPEDLICRRPDLEDLICR